MDPRGPLPSPSLSVPEPAAPERRSPRRVRSEDLLEGAVEILIDHRGREYRLRVTQNGKLILTA